MFCLSSYGLLIRFSDLRCMGLSAQIFIRITELSVSIKLSLENETLPILYMLLCPVVFISDKFQVGIHIHFESRQILPLYVL